MVVPQVKLPKRLNLDGDTERALDSVPGLIAMAFLLNRPAVLTRKTLGGQTITTSCSSLLIASTRTLPAASQFKTFMMTTATGLCQPACVVSWAASSLQTALKLRASASHHGRVLVTSLRKLACDEQT